jgi:hypothetical protein
VSSRDAAIIERRGPWWNVISSSIRGVVPVPMNPAIKRADVVSALFTTRVLGNFPDAYFPRKWKGHSTDPSPVSSLNIGSKEPREFQGKNPRYHCFSLTFTEKSDFTEMIKALRPAFSFRIRYRA